MCSEASRDKTAHDHYNIEVGDIVQINPEQPNVDGWEACLVVVTSVYPWGIQGYVTIPGAQPGKTGNAYIRVKYHQVELVGSAAWIVSNEGPGEEERE